MKLRMVALAVLAIGLSPAQAGPKDDAIDALLKCADVADKLARVDCFDRATPQLRAAAQVPLETQVSPEVQAPTPRPAPVVSLLSGLNPFGGSSDAPTPQQMAYQPPGGEILPITIGVAEFTVFPSGSFTVTLDNGQVWQEHPRRFETPPFKTDEKNYVVIAQAFLGGHNLSLKGQGRLYKVVRVK